MSNSINVGDKFLEAIKDFKEIPFNPKWANGTGYLDFAVKGPEAPKLQNGEVVRSKDNKDRNIGIVGTRVGNVVVFERFSNGQNGVVVSNNPYTVAKLVDITNGAFNIRDIELVFGCKSYLKNIGERIEEILHETE